jgi:hypothetical protein
LSISGISIGNSGRSLYCWALWGYESPEENPRRGDEVGRLHDLDLSIWYGLHRKRVLK